jgi:tRNA threonylcarbamoyladenosine biosynthesis protein TsaB
MKILAIDTSTKYISLAIAEKDRIISSFNRDLEQRHCARLIPEIDKFLKRAKLRLREIGFIAFSLGPGAFTGLRIGAATVKGLALATKIKIVGVPTLDALAQGRFLRQSENCPQGTKKGTLLRLASEPSLIVPIVDARRGNVYASVYSFKNGQLRRHMKYSVLPAAELLKKVKADAIFLGDGLIPYRKTIEDNFKFKAEFADEREWYPKAATVAKMGYELIKNKKFEDPDKLVPMYVYPKDVQVRSGQKSF